MLDRSPRGIFPGQVPPGDIIDDERVARPFGFYRFWDGYISKIFNRTPQPGENPFPTAAEMRSQRRFDGLRRLVPLAWLTDTVVPTDFTERELSRKESWKRSMDTIHVSLPLTGAPLVDRRNAIFLAGARELDLIEVMVRVTYV